MPQFAVPLLGALGLDALVRSQESADVLWKKFKKVMIIMAGLLVVVAGFYFTASYKSENDAMIQQRFVQMASRGQQTPQAQQQATELASSLMERLAGRPAVDLRQRPVANFHTDSPGNGAHRPLSEG